MRNFEFLQPTSLNEASRMLAAGGEGARVLAGGTALLLLMRQRIFSPSHLVWLGSVPHLDAIEVDGAGTLHVGPLVTHHAIAQHPEIRARFPVIAEMARGVANPQIRNMGTLVGNLCHADPASDPAACLLALGASLRVLRGSSERVIPLHGFFTDFYTSVLAPDEVVAGVQVPALPPGARTAYLRFTTTAAEHRPLASVGAMLAVEPSRVCGDVRLALGAVGAVPRRLKSAEEYLRGRQATPDVLARACEIAVSDIDPLVDFRASAGYRREVAKVVLRRCIERALESKR